MSPKYVCLVLMALAAYARASLTREEKSALTAAIFPSIMLCAHEMGIGDGLAWTRGHAENGITCFFGCVYKKYGVIDQNGHFDVEVSKIRAHEYLRTQENLIKMYALIDKCSYVNHEPVSDGVQGCDRAKRLSSCVLANFGDLSPFA